MKRRRYFNYSPEMSSSIARIQILYFVNIIVKRLINARSSKIEVINDVQLLFTQLKKFNFLSYTPTKILNNFISKAAPRFALREFKAGGKRFLLPKPTHVTKIRASFIKSLLKDIVQHNAKTTFGEQVCTEINEFNNGRGITFTKKQDAYVIAKQNRRQAKFVYKRKKFKKNVTNAFKKINLSNI